MIRSKTKQIARFGAIVVMLFAATIACNSGGEVLVLKFWQAPAVPNPYLSAGDKDADAASIILEPLANHDPEGRVTTRLAAEIPTLENGGFAEDFTHITWKLLQDVQWSDGSDFTAHDVVFTWHFCVWNRSSCTNFSRFSDVKEVEALDDYTVKITFFYPTPYPYDVFVGAKMPILSRAQYESCLGLAHASCPDGAGKPNGTGPYRVVEFSSIESRYERNPNYRGARPFFDEVILYGGGDVETAERQVFETAEVDFAWNLQSDPRRLLEKQRLGNAIVAVGFGSSVERIFVNQTNPHPELGEHRSEYLDGNNPHPFLTYRPITAAMTMAIDRQFIADELYQFAGEPTCNIIAGPAEYVSVANDDCLVQDIEGAIEILDSNGVVDTDGDGIREYEGQKLDITFRTTTNSLRQEAQKLIQGWWHEVGIDTTLTHADATFMFGDDNVQHANVAYSRFFADIQKYTELTGIDPELYLAGQLCDHIQSRLNQWSTSNNTRHCDPEYDATFAELTEKPLGAERQALIKRLNDLIVSKHYQIPLVNRGVVSGHATDIHGIRANGWDSQMWNIADWRRGVGG